MCLPKILSPVFMFAYIFHCLSFSPCCCSLLAASISHCLTVALNFHVFLPTKFVSFVFNHFFCYPREWIELFYIGMPVVRTNSRVIGRSVGVRSRDYQIFLDG